MKIFLDIDGSTGEGGGQVLRTALALSLHTGKPFRISNIRAKRKKPGLLHQHLTAVRAAREISGAETQGEELGSTSLTFIPYPVHPGHYHFSIGTAGSTTLVLQTILYPLLFAQGESHLTLEGGTHAMYSPPFEFIKEVFLPLLKQMGGDVEVNLKRYGFYPKGGGQLLVKIMPVSQLKGLEILSRGKLLAKEAKALVAGIPEHIAQRELFRLEEQFKWPTNCLQSMVLPAYQGPGNVLWIKLVSEGITELFTGFGQRGVRAEEVAEKVATMVQDYLAIETPVGEYLADQLLLPLALAGKGKFLSCAPSLHTLTNKEIIQMFLPVLITIVQIERGKWEIQVTQK